MSLSTLPTISVDERPIPASPASVRSIIAQCCEKHEVTLTEMYDDNRNRRRRIYRARQEAIQRVFSEVIINGKPPTSTLIGRWFLRDHSSIINALGSYGRKAPRIRAHRAKVA